MQMKKYILESIQELRDKVTWPTWVQLQSSTILVAISSVIIALIISLMDLGFDTILGAVSYTHLTLPTKA